MKTEDILPGIIIGVATAAILWVFKKIGDCLYNICTGENADVNDN